MKNTLLILLFFLKALSVLGQIDTTELFEEIPSWKPILLNQHDRYIWVDSTENTYSLLENNPNLLPRYTFTLGSLVGYTEKHLIILDVSLLGYLQPLDFIRIGYNAEITPSYILAKPMYLNSQPRFQYRLASDISIKLYRFYKQKYGGHLLTFTTGKVNDKDVLSVEKYLYRTQINLKAGYEWNKRPSDPKSEAFPETVASKIIYYQAGNYSTQLYKLGLEWQKSSSSKSKVNERKIMNFQNTFNYVQLLWIREASAETYAFERVNGEIKEITPPKSFAFPFQNFGIIFGTEVYANRVPEQTSKLYMLRFETGFLPGLSNTKSINNFYVGLNFCLFGRGSKLTIQ